MVRATLIAALLATATHAESLRPYVYRVLEHRVIDGDTVETELDLGFDLRLKSAARIDGIDAPEKSTEAGKLVTEVARRWCNTQQTLIAVSVAKGKFAGRYVGELHGDAERLADYLIRHRLVRLYDGGRRQPWGNAKLRDVERRARVILDD